VLVLKLIVVPVAVLLLGISERVHGPRVAGWLSGFPVIGGPILLFLTLDQGAQFGATAASAALYGMLPWLVFVSVYARCAQSLDWYWSAAFSFLAWTLAAFAAVSLVGVSPWLDILPFAAALAAIAHYSKVKRSDEEREHKWWRLGVRMLAGAVLTLAIAQLAGRLGARWSGIFSFFPVIGSIVAVSNHVEHGPRSVTEAVAGMVLGIMSVEIFSLILSLMLPHTGIWQAFALSLAAAMTTHLGAWFVLRRFS
jgi:hypothetical protein